MGNTCCTKEPEKTKSYLDENEILLTRSKMRTPQSIKRVVNEEYLRIVPRKAYYLKSKNTRDIFKYKCPLFAAGGGGGDDQGEINLFSNSLEHMGTFMGYKIAILSLCAISTKILASGAYDKNIKIWNIEERVIMSTLSGHTDRITALCHLERGQLVSGSYDESLIIWSKLPGSSSTYSHGQVLTGHKSGIRGIIRISKAEIISGEYKGALRIWNIDEGVCIRHISSLGGCYLTQMKQHHEGEVAIGYRGKVFVLGAANNWEAPIKQFRVCEGHSIEFLERDLLLRGGYKGQLEFIDYSQTDCSMPSPIEGIHFSSIKAIQKIAKNILIIYVYKYLKAIDPLTRKCHIKLRIINQDNTAAIVYFY